MNLLKNTLVSKLMLVALMLVGARSAFAASELSIPSVTFNDYEVKEIPVTFKYDGNIGGLQFDVKLSKSLVFAGDASEAIVRNASFFSDGQNMAPKIFGSPNDENPQWARIVISSRRNNAFAAKEGVVVTLRVRVKDNHLDNTVEKNPEFAVTINNAKASDPTGQTLESVSCPAVGGDQVSEVKMSIDGGDFVMNPTTEKSVAINLDNLQIEVGTIQFDVIIPEGFSMKNYQLTNRASNAAFLDYFPDKKNPNNVRFIVSDEVTNVAYTKNEGAIMTFTLVAPETFGKTAEINVQEIIASTKIGDKFKEFVAPDFKVIVTNGADAKTTADAKVAELEKALTAALADIAKNYPDVKDQFKGEEIAANIETLKKAIATAYADLSLSDPEKYKEVMAPADEIATAIAALVPAAKAEVDRVAANKAANKADNDKIAALETKLAETLAEVAKTYPEYDVTADKAAADKAIADAKKAAADNLKAVEKEGTYASTLSEEAIQTAIDAIAKNAKADADKKAEAAEAARVAANKAAYDKDIAAIAPYEAQLAVALEAVKGNPAYDVTADKAAAEKAIDDAKKAAEANLKAVEKEGNYKSTLDLAPIAAAIAAISKNADAATAEAARVAANKAAYDKDLAAIAALETKLADALAEIAKTYPDYDAAADKAAADKAIADAKKAAADNLKAVEKEGNYASTLDAAAVEATIAAIAENAKADADKKAEEALKAANDAAKAKADAKVAELNKALADAVAKIKETCPLVAEMFDGEAEKASIASLESAIAAAYDAKTLAADYDNVIAPAETINAAIATLVKEAEAAQAAAVAEAARVEANEKAYKAELAQIDALVKELEDEIAKFNPEWTNLQYETQLNVRNYIEGLSNKVENEKNRVADEGNYNNQLKASDLAMARGLISEYVQKVETSGIDSIVADENLGNVRIYTIDGVQHNRLVPGVNIIVKEDGTTSKVYVK